MSSMNGSHTAGNLNWKTKANIKAIALEMYDNFKRERLTSLAAAVAYNTIFALPAVILLTVMAAALVNQATDIAVMSRLRDLIQDHAPASTQQLLNDQVDRAVADVSGSGLSIGIIVAAVIALWSGSNAVGSLMEAFNLAYGVEENRSFGRKKLMTVGLTLLLAISVNLAFALLVFGHRIGKWLADWIGAGGVFNVVWNIGRWPMAVVAIGSFLSLLYHFGPNVQHPFRWITPGGILATLLWLVATAGFGIYLQFSDPGSAFGIVGSALVLLFFLDVTAIVFILGAELNAILAQFENEHFESNA